MATAFRMEHPWILYGLPFAGVLIVWMYQWERKQERSSTNMVLDAIHAEREIPLKTAPLIFISTILTHLFGGSAGREGAALQLGGSIGNFLGRILRIDENDRRVMNYGRNERSLFRPVWHAHGGHGVLHGGCQRGNHALRSPGALRGGVLYCLWGCLVISGLTESASRYAFCRD